MEQLYFSLYEKNHTELGKKLRILVTGSPSCGKSWIANALLGEKEFLESAIPLVSSSNRRSCSRCINGVSITIEECDQYKLKNRLLCGAALKITDEPEFVSVVVYCHVGTDSGFPDAGFLQSIRQLAPLCVAITKTRAEASTHTYFRKNAIAYTEICQAPDDLPKLTALLADTLNRLGHSRISLWKRFPILLCKQSLAMFPFRVLLPALSLLSYWAGSAIGLFLPGTRLLLSMNVCIATACIGLLITPKQHSQNRRVLSIVSGICASVLLGNFMWIKSQQQ